MVRPPRRAHEKDEPSFLRRERILNHIIPRHSRGKWGELQRYRFYMLIGHIAWLPLTTHVFARVNQWRASEWWIRYA